MSRIINEAKVKNPLIVGIREQLEHRALWMYLLCDEAEKHGLKAEDFAPDAIKRCGLYQGQNLVKMENRGTFVISRSPSKRRLDQARAAR